MVGYDILIGLKLMKIYIFVLLKVVVSMDFKMMNPLSKSLKILMTFVKKCRSVNAPASFHSPVAL